MESNKNEINYGSFVNKNGLYIPKTKNYQLETKKVNTIADAKKTISKFDKNLPVDFDVVPEGYAVYDWEIHKTDKAEAKKIKKEKKSKVKKQTAKINKAEKTKKPEKNKKKAEKVALKNDSRNEQESVGLEKNKTSIGVKLLLIISTLIIVALGGITVLVSYFVSTDTKISAEDNNLTINSRSAADVENRFSKLMSSVGMLLDLQNTKQSETEEKMNTSMFFKRNNDIVAVFIPSAEKKYVNTTFLIQKEIEETLLDEYITLEEDSEEEAQSGNLVLRNASPYFNAPVIAFFYPLYEGEKITTAVVLYSAEDLWESFSSGSINMSFFVNNEGEVLVHPDYDLMMNGVDYTENFIVQTMMESPKNNEQVTFIQDENEYIGAYRKLSSGNGAVITVVKTSVILEAVNATTRRNIYLTIAILSLAILIIYLFAKSLSRPLKTLTAVANEISKANFNTDLFDELSSKRHDEIGVLIRSTQQEREILNTFTKLTNKGVTEAIVLKKIDFEPHLKDITIFFSDIRGFTAISDGFKNRFGEESAAEIIGFLNDYMSRMVTCITNTGGVVDKFEGDAIMACWGVLRNDDLDCELPLEEHINKVQRKLNKILSEEEKTQIIEKRKDFEQSHQQHIMDDALSAITASIAMRYSLMKYNKDAEAFTEAHKNEPLAKYKPHIRIGSGLNTGRATVGFMGSFDKMEFTSIGDAVNFASRTEASNKPCGTDLLITEDTYNLLKKKYIRCEENNFTIQEEDLENEVIAEMIPVEFEVKGKGAQHFYAVVNLPNFDIEKFFKKGDSEFVIDEACRKAVGPTGPKNMHEVRSMLGIPEPEFEGVNLDEEENKIQVKGQKSSS